MRIVNLLTEEFHTRLADRDVKLELSEAARAFIARQGYAPVYGARPLRRFLQRELETRIGRALVAGEVYDGATIRIDVNRDELSVDIVNP